MAETLTDKQLRNIEKYVVKLKKKLNRTDLDYTVQTSINSTDPKQTNWAVQITPPAIGLAPITYIAKSPDELVAQLKVSIENIDYTAVEIAWHNAQIEACNRTIEFHTERIQRLESGEEDETSEETTTEVVES